MGALSALSKESSRSSVLGSLDGSGHFTNQECGWLCAFTTQRLCVHRLRCQFASKRSPPELLPANSPRAEHESRRAMMSAPFVSRSRDEPEGVGRVEDASFHSRSRH